MQAIQMKNDDGEYILLVLRPEEGNNVTEKHLEDLVPIMKRYCNSFSSNFDDISISDGNINFNNSSMNDINQIIKICKSKISEKVIVPQYTDVGPAVRHRPLYFGLNNDENGIEVKFTELGEFNTIEKAIEYLS